MQERGFHAVANTTDTVKTDENWRSPLPHKTVAVHAGLGWIGKNCLLITERYGGAVRLSSLLTDAPLPFDAPVEKSRCGGCSACVERCPAKAFTGATWTPGIEREKLFDWKRCYPEQLRRMKQATGIETDLCGLCFAVWLPTPSGICGKNKKKRRSLWGAPFSLSRQVGEILIAVLGQADGEGHLAIRSLQLGNRNV